MLFSNGPSFNQMVSWKPSKVDALILNIDVKWKKDAPIVGRVVSLETQKEDEFSASPKRLIPVIHKMLNYKWLLDRVF